MYYYLNGNAINDVLFTVLEVLLRLKKRDKPYHGAVLRQYKVRIWTNDSSTLESYNHFKWTVGRLTREMKGQKSTQLPFLENKDIFSKDVQSGTWA